MKDCFIDLDIVFVDDQPVASRPNESRATARADESQAAYEIGSKPGQPDLEIQHAVLEFAAGTIDAIDFPSGTEWNLTPCSRSRWPNNPNLECRPILPHANPAHLDGGLCRRGVLSVPSQPLGPPVGGLLAGVRSIEWARFEPRTI